jgi:prepilin-type N-terminal cleavage/methylation domain-containing protein
MKKYNGFTLVELMIVVAIVGILSVVAVPSMRSYLSNTASNSLSNTLLIDIMYARNHAISNGVIVKIIPTGGADTGVSTFDPTTGGVNWGGGWTIFEDDNNNNVIDPDPDPDINENILRSHLSFGPDAHISSGPGAHIGGGPVTVLDINNPIGFDASGFSITDGVLSVATFGCAGDNARTLQINRIGQVIGNDVQCPFDFTNL